MVAEPETYHLFSIRTRHIQAVGFRIRDPKDPLLKTDDDFDCLAESRSHFFNRILIMPGWSSPAIRQACNV